MRRFSLMIACFLTAWPVQAGLPPFNQEELNKWWAQHAEPGSWEKGFSERQKVLLSLHEQEGTKLFTENPDFTSWFYTQTWLKTGLNTPSLSQNAEWAQAFVELGKIPEVSHLFVKSFRPGDDLAKACEILIQLHLSQPEKTRDYAALAVAYALVFDQPFPGNWPHHQVKESAVPVDNTNPVERFAFYIKANENKDLDFDLKTLSFHELKFMVDSIISLDELSYAQKSKFSRTKLDRAFSSINYDTARIKTQNYDWAYNNYRLQDIEMNGGICVDQAYYSSMMGKGRGIPTLYFSGQGSDGGHAWFGFMSRSGKWELDCGRYESQNYPIGYARDPQNWQTINDAELEFLFKDLPKNPNYAASQAAFIWAIEQTNSRTDPAVLISYYDNSRSLAPENPEIWKYQRFVMQKAGMEDAEFRKFYEQWILQFAKNSDMKVEGQSALLEILNKTRDPMAAQIQSDLVKENRRKRFDLGIGAGAGAIFEQIEAKNWEEADKAFKKIIRQFDDKGGGNLFYQIIQPYIATCLEEGQRELAADAFKYADKKIERQKGSILDEEFNKLDIAINRRPK